MGQAIGQILPLAVGAAISPVPIIASVLLLLTPRAAATGTAYVVGWLLGMIALGAVMLLIAHPAGASSNGAPATWVSVLELVLGILVILVALRQWRSRPHGDAEPPTPKWMGAIESFNVGKAFGAGLFLGALNPKNIPLTIAAGASIAATGISGADQAVVLVVFALVGTVGVAVPLVIYLATGDRAPHLLDGLRYWLARNNAVIMTVLLVVIGSKILGDAISGLS
jgi:threonine/homoserine/homoserine lactone efflux protein